MNRDYKGRKKYGAKVWGPIAVCFSTIWLLGLASAYLFFWIDLAISTGALYLFGLYIIFYISPVCFGRHLLVLVHPIRLP